jgi:hypothetical protein
MPEVRAHAMGSATETATAVEGLPGMSGDPEPRRYLYQATLVLGGESKVVRVRETHPDLARATLEAQYPGWRITTISHRVGDDWVAAP